jgi:predicted lipase
VISVYFFVLLQRVDHVRGNITKAFSGAVNATGQGIKGAVDATTGLIANNTPGLKNIVGTYVHSGFWEAYIQLRSYIHTALRKELMKTPTTIFFTGHSLGENFSL